MTASTIASLIQYAVLPWLFLLFAVVVLKLLRGDIKTAGLLRTHPGGPIDPERVAVMGTTLFVLGGYALTALDTGAIFDTATKTYHMPDVPESALVLFAGANGIYLSGKLLRR